MLQETRLLTQSHLFAQAADNWAFNRGLVLTDGVSQAMRTSNNLSDLTDSNVARVNLGLRIGTDIQAHSVVLDRYITSTPSDLALALFTQPTALAWRNTLGITPINGTVTSIDVDGGTTGLSVYGGPIVSSGTLTLDGTLTVSHGGTGVTSLAALRTALDVGRLAGMSDVNVSILPTQNQVLAWSNITSKWVPVTVPIAALDTDTSLGVGSDISVPSQRAVKLYVDNTLASLNLSLSSLTGTLPASKGGTGVASLAALKTALNIGTLASLSDVNVPSTPAQDQVLAWSNVTSKWNPVTVPIAALDTDAGLTANSDGRVASQKATKLYVDNRLASLTLSASAITGTLAVTNGGTGVTTLGALSTALKASSGEPNRISMLDYFVSGMADYAPAINAAIAAAGLLGKSCDVIVPSGDWPASSVTLVLDQERVNLVGPGTLLDATVHVGRTFAVVNADSTKMELRGKISCNFTCSSPSTTRTAIELQYVRDFSISSRITGYNVGVSAIAGNNSQVFGQMVSKIDIKGCRFVDCMRAILSVRNTTGPTLQYADWNIIDNYFTPTSTAPRCLRNVELEGLDGLNWSDNYCFMPGSGSADMVKQQNLKLQRCTNISITGGQWFEPGAEAIWLDMCAFWSINGGDFQFVGQNTPSSVIKVTGGDTVGDKYCHGYIGGITGQCSTKYVVEILDNCSYITVAPLQFRYPAATTRYYGVGTIPATVYGIFAAPTTFYIWAMPLGITSPNAFKMNELEGQNSSIFNLLGDYMATKYGVCDSTDGGRIIGFTGPVPNSNLTAQVGSLVLRQTGGVGQTAWVKELGSGTNTQWLPVKLQRYGNTASRPASLGTTDAGFDYFDTTINRPIWWSGSTWSDPITALDTDGTLAANSDVKIPSQKAVKTYVDGSLTSTKIDAVGGDPTARRAVANAINFDVFLPSKDGSVDVKQKLKDAVALVVSTGGTRLLISRGRYRVDITGDADTILLPSYFTLDCEPGVTFVWNYWGSPLFAAINKTDVSIIGPTFEWGGTFNTPYVGGARDAFSYGTAIPNYEWATHVAFCGTDNVLFERISCQGTTTSNIMNSLAIFKSKSDLVTPIRNIKVKNISLNDICQGFLAGGMESFEFIDIRSYRYANNSAALYGPGHVIYFIDNAVPTTFGNVQVRDFASTQLSTYANGSHTISSKNVQDTTFDIYSARPEGAVNIWKSQRNKYRVVYTSADTTTDGGNGIVFFPGVTGNFNYDNEFDCNLTIAPGRDVSAVNQSSVVFGNQIRRMRGVFRITSTVTGSESAQTCKFSCQDSTFSLAITSLTSAVSKKADIVFYDEATVARNSIDLKVIAANAATSSPRVIWGTAGVNNRVRFYPSSLFDYDRLTGFADTRGNSLTIAGGGDMLSNVTAATGTSPSFTLQLPNNGVYNLDATIRSSDGNHGLSGLYRIVWDSGNSTNNYATVQLLGSTSSKGSTITGIAVSVNSSGVVTVASTTTGSDTFSCRMGLSKGAGF